MFKKKIIVVYLGCYGLDGQQTSVKMEEARNIMRLSWWDKLWHIVYIISDNESYNTTIKVF